MLNKNKHLQVTASGGQLYVFSRAKICFKFFQTLFLLNFKAECYNIKNYNNSKLKINLLIA